MAAVARDEEEIVICGHTTKVGENTFVCVKPPHPTPEDWDTGATRGSVVGGSFVEPAPGDRHHYVNEKRVRSDG